MQLAHKSLEGHNNLCWRAEKRNPAACRELRQQNQTGFPEMGIRFFTNGGPEHPQKKKGINR